MIANQRSSTRSPPSISHPLPAQLAHRPRSNTPLASFSKGHKPSLSKSMAWLGRSSAQYAPSKPLRISEPKLVNTFDIIHSPRSGALGSGAVVVKTPQDALSAQFYEEEEEEEEYSEDVEVEMYPEDECRRLPPAPTSPDLPPIPVEQDVREPSPPEDTAVSRAPTQSPPLAPVASTSAAPCASATNRSSGHSEYPPPVPPLPSNITSAPIQPLFDPILVGVPPSGAMDPSKIIVALETGTSTHRTTLMTLTSRPSHLATYLTSLLPRPEADTSSTHSRVSEVSAPDGSFNSIFHQHLASSGLLSQAPSSIHVFLDRPSAPYAHIMAYLRSAPSTPECPAMLPRAVQFISSSSSRLEALLELRDEASYLDLEELRQLCNAEIRNRESIFSHTHVGSTGSAVSVHSVHTFRERPSSEPHRADGPSNRDSIVTHRSAPKERGSVATRSAEQIVQLTTHTRSQSHGRQERTAPLRSPPICSTPPPGWI